MKKEYDAVIVGGGPGGSSTALFLKKNGVDKVLLIDKAKFPRDKICGDAFSGKSVGIAKELGIAQDFEKVPHEGVYGVLFSSPKGTMVEIPFPGAEGKKNAKPGFCVRRINGDNVLFQNARKAVDTLEEFTITDLLWENGFVAGFEKKGRGPKKFLDIILAYEKDRGAIDGLKFISTPSRRIYKKHQLIRPVRQGFGMAVVSTSQGIMTDKEVRKKKIGGQVLFEIW